MKNLFIVLLVLCVLKIGVFAASENNLAPNTVGSVNISFDGLQVLCTGSSNRYSLAILDVEHHTPEITITKVAGARRAVVARITKDQLRGTLEFRKSGNNSVSRHLPESAYTDPHDFRYTIDLETDLFQRQLHLDSTKIFGRVHFYDGLFYGANLSDQRLTFYYNETQSSFNRLVAEPSAWINLLPGEALNIVGGTTSLQLPYESNSRYEIAVTNLPPPTMADMNHFNYYYKAITDEVKQFAPVLIKPITYSPRPILCQTVVFSKSSLNDSE